MVALRGKLAIVYTKLFVSVCVFVVGFRLASSVLEPWMESVNISTDYKMSLAVAYLMSMRVLSTVQVSDAKSM